MDDTSIIDRGNAAVKAVWEMDTPTLEATSLEERFNCINVIKSGLYARFPAPQDTPAEEIDRSSIPLQHLGVLHRITNSLKLSQNYHDFVIKITKDAVENLTSNTHYVDKFLRWGELDEQEKLSLAQEFHNSIIRQAKTELQLMGANFGLHHSVKPLTISPFYDEPYISNEGDISSFDGYALVHHDEWPGVSDLGINMHDGSGFDTPEETIETIAHESAHVIEGLLAYTFGHHPPFIPEELLLDAKLLFHMYDKNAYVASRLPTIYENQANEIVAREAGLVAKNIVSNAMLKRLSPP